MSDRDCKTLLASINDAEGSAQIINTNPDSKENGTIVILEENQSHPLWCELKKSGKIGPTVGLDELADMAATIAASHPGNLLEAFPRALELDRYLVVISVVGILLFAALCAGTFNDQEKYERARIESQLNWSKQKEHLEGLKRNQREILFLRSQIPVESKARVADMHAETLALAAAVPESLLLRSATISNDGSIAFEALVVGSSFDPDRARASFSDYGFIPDAANGWVYDVAGGNVRVKGKFLSHQP